MWCITVMQYTNQKYSWNSPQVIHIEVPRVTPGAAYGLHREQRGAFENRNINVSIFQTHIIIFACIVSPMIATSHSQIANRPYF